MAVQSSVEILIVDDEPSVCNLLAKFLQPEGYRCHTANSGEEAIKILQDKKIALVITDIMMPGMSGLDLLNVIKPVFPSTAVLVVTAVDDKETGVLAIESGAFGYIIKPFDRNEILINVANALERRRLSLASREKGPMAYKDDCFSLKRRDPIKVQPKVIVNRMKEGASELEIMKEFNLSAKALHSLADQLAASGHWPESPTLAKVYKDTGTVALDLKDAGRPERRPGKVTISARDVLKCVESGMSDSELMERYGISPKGLQSLFRKLVSAGLISGAQLDKRMSETHNWVILDE